MNIEEVRNAALEKQTQMNEKWFAIRVTKLSERSHLVLTHLLAGSNEQDIIEAILIHNNPNTARREPEIRAAEQDKNISLGEIAHVFGLFVYQRSS